MRFKAEKVIHQKVNNSEIDLDEDYVLVSPTELKKEIESIFAKVK